MTSIKLRTQTFGEQVELKILLTHPMENGRNRDAITGELIAAHYIQELAVELNGKLIVPIHLGPSIAANPYLSLRLNSVMTGDKIRVYWLDNHGDGDSQEITVN